MDTWINNNNDDETFSWNHALAMTMIVSSFSSCGNLKPFHYKIQQELFHKVFFTLFVIKHISMMVLNKFYLSWTSRLEQSSWVTDSLLSSWLCETC